ncbi:hypothetical protein CLE01_33990 [Cryobacterium levicorallinum]|uniref:Integrase core domain-containing protein n=1 Tax=Cryobacterium levicorallinum TaxID=995038 RepID=A0ABY1EIK8_9MICO|nr:hypothetical protein CLE01_33990 [Cryobacterium levicorallinum]SFH99699.1 Integrase core domain-containing protein [Cryobacterium levicorallinum]
MRTASPPQSLISVTDHTMLAFTFASDHDINGGLSYGGIEPEDGSGWLSRLPPSGALLLRQLGDLITGKLNKTAIATLVERTTRYVMLVHLPGAHTTDAVRDGLVATIGTLPAHLRGSLTWDQGSEMSTHKSFTTATDMPVYFCDPASPWQRGSNESTNGLLRQYLPKGSDLSVYGLEDLERVAQELNGRPRKTLGWDTPAERFRDLLIST